MVVKAGEKKYTQKQIYEAIFTHAQECGDIEGIPSEVVMEFAEKKLAQLENKTSKTDTKKNEEHREVMNMIISVLCNSDSPMKCNAIMEAVNAENGTKFSSSKINAMLRKLLPPSDKNPDGSGEVIRTEKGKDVLFSLAE